jgi:hypothetical protein
MRLLTTDPLFPWDKLPDSLGLKNVADLLDLLPDSKLIAALQRHRGRGRNDYPMHVLWRVHNVRYLLRHITMESCLEELGRNPALRRVVGIVREAEVPPPYVMSRFLLVLGMKEHLKLMEEMFERLAGELASAVPDLGRHLAGDSSALSARGDAPGKTPEGLPQPNGARKQYHDEDGKVVRTLEWYGYKLHLLADVRHEVIVAAKVTEGTGDDAEQLADLLDQAQRVLPAERIQTLAYDKAADHQKTHALLAGHEIKPVIENRELWQDEMERVLENCRAANVVFDEAGTIYCYDMTSPVPCKRKMSYIGYEKSRGTLKYRCPARHEGIPCPSDKRCNGESSYGMTVRVKSQDDLRRFPPIPRATAEFERRYKGRTAVERVNARMKLFWGADDGNVTGAARFHAHVHTILLVHVSIARLLASSPRHEGKSLSPTRPSEIARRLSRPALK